MKFSLFALLPLLALAPLTRAATTYYVSGTGADQNDGLSRATAFRTIQKAADLTKPGDTVLIMDGTYTNSWPGGPVVELKNSGTEDAWITFKAAPDQHPVLSFTGEQGIYSKNASYIEINGLTIIGCNATTTLDYAMAHKDQEDPRCDGSGIFLDGRGQGSNLPHHYRILNNSVSECGGGGIGACEADELDIERNHVFDNSWYTRWGTSGISVCVMRDANRRIGYRTIIRGNIVYNNHTLVPCVQSHDLSDGNGIIIDSNNETHYSGRTLVANNLCVHNGGSGIHTFHSAHVDIVNNTTWHNSQKLDYGEIFANGSSDVNIVNNICVAEDGKPMNSDWNHNQKITYDHNLMFGGKPPVVKGNHTLNVDPLFVEPGPDFAKADFHLQPNSPAHRAILVDSSTPPLLLTGAPRDFSGAIDLGMYAAP
jgi:hypothetical protein